MTQPVYDDLLIKCANLDVGQRDIRCLDGMIAAIDDDLTPLDNERVINAKGGSVIKGLYDHHLHLFSLAARRYSVDCGPPQITTAEELKRILAETSGHGWIRGIGYHESVAGELTTAQLDQWQRTRPVRIQHRSGRVWYLNSAAKSELGLSKRDTNQLFRQDDWVRAQLPIPADIYENLGEVSADLAAFGITHVTDATPTNDEAARHSIGQYCVNQIVELMGGMGLHQGCYKIILDDYQLMDLGELVQTIRRAHEINRTIAIHCVSRIETIFALSAIEEAGAVVGDRLEHGMVMSQELIDWASKLGLTVVPNPCLIYDRGDQYLVDAEPRDVRHIQPIRSLDQAGVHMLGGSDAPFGSINPWRAMQSAVDRTTLAGKTLTQHESISPTIALRLFSKFGTKTKTIYPVVGEKADLCLLDRPWKDAESNLASLRVLATVCQGRLSYQSEDL